MLWKRNFYLRELLAPAVPRLLAELVLVEYRRGQRIASSSADTLVMFPLTAVFATIAHPPGAETCFTAILSSRDALFGRRGDISEEVPYLVEVIGAGFALNVPKETFVDMLGADVWAGLYAMVGFSWVTNTAIINSSCNASHAVTRRVARMLAHAGDAFGFGRDVTLSQNQIADYLKVRRESVSESLEPFKRHGIIKTHRGRIEIADRVILRESACRCYEATRTLSRLLWSRCKTMTAERSPARVERHGRSSISLS